MVVERFFEGVALWEAGCFEEGLRSLSYSLYLCALVESIDDR